MVYIMFLIHHLIRPIWSLVFNIFYFIPKIYLEYWSDENIKTKILQNKRIWEDIQDIYDLMDYYKDNFKYIYDGFKGWFDHDNCYLEFLKGADCDDMGRYAHNKLKQLGYESCRIGIYNNYSGIKSWHYDCVFKRYNKVYLFNYGNIIEGKNLEDCIYQLGRLSKLFRYNENYVWYCSY